MGNFGHRTIVVEGANAKNVYDFMSEILNIFNRRSSGVILRKMFGVRKNDLLLRKNSVLRYG